MNRSLRKFACLWIAGTSALAGFSLGCQDRTETGYEPRPLNMTNDQRRALYAAPFSPEATQGQDSAKLHKPGFGGGM